MILADLELSYGRHRVSYAAWEWGRGAEGRVLNTRKVDWLKIQQ